MKDKFIHEHPLITTATALGLGLLAPVGVKILAQQSSQWREGRDFESDRPADDGDNEGQEFIYRHPLVTTGVALGALLLAPAGLNLVQQMLAEMATDTESDDHQRDDAAGADGPTAKASEAQRSAPISSLSDGRDDGNADDDDFIHQHPFITIAAALGVGLLAPIGLNLMAQLQSAAPEEGAGEEEREAAGAKPLPGKAPPDRASDRRRGDDEAPEASVLRQRAFMANAAALGAGLLGAMTLLSNRQRSRSASGQGGAKAKRGRAARKPSTDHGAYDIGALDMEFTTHRPGGKNIELSFGWKKRPIDAPESDWPLDNTGFTFDRPDGKHTAFKMTRKNRPLPEGYGDDIRRGLGQATMEFVSRRPDDGAVRFTWEKIPPATTDQEPAGLSDDDGREPAPGGPANPQKGNGAKKAAPE